MQIDRETDVSVTGLYRVKIMVPEGETPTLREVVGWSTRNLQVFGANRQLDHILCDVMHTLPSQSHRVDVERWFCHPERLNIPYGTANEKLWASKIVQVASVGYVHAPKPITSEKKRLGHSSPAVEREVYSASTRSAS